MATEYVTASVTIIRFDKFFDLMKIIIFYSNLMLNFNEEMFPLSTLSARQPKKW